MFTGKTVLVTGGTGSFGHHFASYVLSHFKPRKLVIFSRDEYKQFIMAGEFRQYKEILRFFIGDVRDESRLRMAMKNVDYVVHAAAMKQVPTCEYNPNEAIKTNINGAMNVITAALDAGVKKVVALSTDKAVNPINLYGGTKLVSDKLFVSANSYSGTNGPRFMIVRYGNVAGSRGSVIPFFQRLINEGATELPVTDIRMTRFWISLEQGVELVVRAFTEGNGGETFIAKIPSFRITDLAQAMLPGGTVREIGIREGEKLNEIMITREDSGTTYEYERHYVIYPHYNWWSEGEVIPGGKPVPYGFEYSSGNNTEWLDVTALRKELEQVQVEHVLRRKY